MLSDSLYIAVQQPASSPIWETILAIFVALIGGGFITYYFERKREKRKAERFLNIIKSEIRMNIDAMTEKEIQDNPYLPHKTWSSFYDSNTSEIVSYNSDKVAENIVTFYSTLEMLKTRDLENEDLDIRLQKKDFDYGEILEQRRILGQSKKSLRNQLIEISDDILNIK